MRIYIFKKFLDFLERHSFGLIARIQIQILLLATAKGFQKKAKIILFSKDCLEEYAKFTKACMKNQSDQKRLFGISYELGRRIREIAGFTDKGDLQRLVFYLYRNIGITMTGDIPGEVHVLNCYFSQLYSSAECSEISAMDAGIIAGICGNGTLIFTQRITEGCQYCKAHFDPLGTVLPGTASTYSCASQNRS